MKHKKEAIIKTYKTRNTYNPDRPLGEYIKRWCVMHGVSQKQFAVSVGYGSKHQIWTLKSCSIEKLFSIVDFMASKSPLPEDFYLARLKAVIQGKYTWTR